MTALQEHIISRVKLKLSSQNINNIDLVLLSLPDTDLEINQYGVNNVILDIIDDTLNYIRG